MGKRVYNIEEYGSIQLDYIEAKLVFHNHVVQFIYNLIIRCHGNEEARRVLWDILEQGEKNSKRFFERQSLDVDSIGRNKTTRYDGNKSNDAKNYAACLLNPLL